ncbi:MAG: IPT/TIG domain-containing protein [Bryobacteraceae bacterium]
MSQSYPFTAPVSDGEFITLYGSGLANATASASLPFPTRFNGVQVMINQVAAPIFYVSPTQISVVVPFGTESNPVAQIYVINNGTQSNLVTEYTGTTSLGVFTNNPEGGLGYAAALHPDYSVISESSPAKIGETVALYLTGMGQVAPRVQNGAPAPSSPLSYTTFTPLVFLLDASGNYLSAKVGFTGLAPGYAGLYQINFTVPSGLASGKASLEIIGPDSDTFQAILPLTTN